MTVTPLQKTGWSALALIVTAQFMVILDVAIVNVALPSIQSDLGFSDATIQWVVAAYAIFFGGVLLLGGRLADLFGRRRLFMVGLAVFGATSLLCGLAWSEGTLIAFRALQGLGGALMAPAALALLMTTFAEGRERNVALGVYGAASGSGAAAGVLLGGVLTSYLHWSWIFFINVPVAVAAIALTPVLLRESRANLDAPPLRPRRSRRSITAGLMLLVYALTRATTDGWGAPLTIGLLVASAALIGGFVLIEHRSPQPLLPLRIFRLPTLAAANVIMLLVGAVTFSEFFVLSLYAAGRPALHGGADRGGVRGVRADGRRRLEHRSGPDRQDRDQGDAHAGAARLGGVDRLAHPPSGRRPLLLGSVPGVRARRRRPRRSRSCRSRSRASPAWNAPMRAWRPGS